MFGDSCQEDYECAQELNLICATNDMRACQCRRGYVWNIIAKMCYMIDEHPYDNGTQPLHFTPLERLKNTIDKKGESV
jgi:hypothetical protein